MKKIPNIFKLSTTQTVMVAALALGVTAGGFAAAYQQQPTKPKVTTLKTVSDTSPPSTDASSTSPTATAPTAPGSTTTQKTVNTQTTTVAAATSTDTQTIQPEIVKIVKSVFDGDNDSGVCNLNYSDGTNGQVEATVTHISQQWHVTLDENNCQDFVGQAKQ